MLALPHAVSSTEPHQYFRFTSATPCRAGSYGRQSACAEDYGSVVVADCCAADKLSTNSYHVIRVRRLQHGQYYTS